jgi:hypothetical protein
MPSRVSEHTPVYDTSVFINCPYDRKYLPLFRAIVFAVHDCGFVARAAAASEDSSEVRITKIVEMTRGSRYGIHDISRIELSRGTGYPRFNMPLELGIFLGAKEFGDSDQQRKECLVLDREPRRYQAFVSDLAGQDIRSHGDGEHGAIEAIRNFFSTKQPGRILPGPSRMTARYDAFKAALPAAARKYHLKVSELGFYEYREMVLAFLKANPWNVPKTRKRRS